jgi:hypothetical protein
MSPNGPHAESYDRLGDLLDGIAALLSLWLVALILADLHGPLRILLGAAFAFFVPGRAIVSNWPRMGQWSQAAMSLVLSLAVLVLLATVTLWAHEWHPLGLFETEAGLSLAGLGTGVVRRHQSNPAGLLSPRTAERKRWPVSGILLPVSLTLWAVGVARTDARVLGPYGLLTVLPLVCYAGIALLVVSVTIELARGCPSRLRMSAHAVALVVMLYGTAPIVYSLGRYPWLYKTVGVVQYVGVHAQVNQQIDIYQNWPGFFAFVAWFDKVAGVASPLGYAKWAQLVVEIAALPLLNLIYQALSLPLRQRWVALLLYSASNWIAQDYLSPQALGTLLSLGIMAIALRWMYAADPPDRSGPPGQRRGGNSLFLVALVLVYFVLTFTHELSPYIVAVQLVVLSIAGLLRPRWLALALVAIAVGYFIPHFSFVNSHYQIVSSIGSFFTNAAPPSIAGSGYAVPASQRLIQHCADGLSALVWLLSLLGAWLGRRSRRTVLTLILLAYSPVVVLIAGAYGDEGILRVFLFSLPWSAALAASVLAPTPAPVPAPVPAPGAGSRRRDRNDGASRWRGQLPAGALRIPITLGAILVLFLVAFFGDDQFNVMSAPEVAAVTSFMQTAPAGPVFYAIDNAPVDDTARYYLFPFTAIFGIGAVWGTKPPKPNIAAVLASEADRYTRGREPAYVMVTPSMVSYGRAYGVPVSNFTTLLSSLAHSKIWKPIVNDAGTAIYELPPMKFASGVPDAGLTPYFAVP